MSANLIQIAVEYDNGSRYVSIDQYDDAIERLAYLAENGDHEAQRYLDGV